MLQKPKYSWIIYLLTAIICLVARQHLLFNIGLTDYDSVRNWQIVQEIGGGNFQNLFHHASPGFFLFFGIFAVLFKGTYLFIFLNTFFSIGAVLLLIRFFHKNFAAPLPEACLTGLIFGLSVFTVSAGRNFSTESISLFLSMLMIERYYIRLIHKNRKALLQAAGYLALGLTINYKLLLVLPVALVLEIFQRDGLLNFRTLITIGIILALPYVIFGIVAVFINQPFYRLPAAVLSINNPTKPNPALRTGRFNFDFLYYFRYFLDFELPLLVPALILFPFLFKDKLFLKSSQTGLNAYQFLFLVVYLFFLGMHLLLKAPRGLTFIFGPIYFIFYLVLHRLVTTRWLYLILVISISYQVWKLQQEIYAYSDTSYDEVAAFLKRNKVKKIATTVGRNLIPFAQAQGIEVTPIFSEEELKQLKKEGYEYILLDGYYRVANIKKFEKLEQLTVIKTWPEPTVLAPIIFLDHAEFTGLTYAQILTSQRHIAQDSVQLRLLSVP